MTDLTLPSAPSAAADRLEHYCVVLTRPIAFIGVLGMLLAAGVTVVDVLMRWLASTAITALNEITAMVFAVALSRTPRSNSHVMSMTIANAGIFMRIGIPAMCGALSKVEQHL